MNRLQKILVAGTLIPAMSLLPVANALAQVPPKDHAPSGATRGAPGEHHGAGMEHGGAMAPHPGEMEHGAAMHADTPHPAAAAHAVAPVPHVAETKAAPAATKTAPQVPAPSRTAAAPAAVKEHPATAAQDERRAAPSGIAQEQHPAAANHARDQRQGAPEHAAQGQRPGAPEHAAQAPAPAVTSASGPGAPPSRNAAAAPNAPMPSGQRDNAGRMPPNGAPGAARYGERNDHGISPAGAVAIGAAAGFAGGFIAATVGAQRLDDIRHDRHEVVEDGRTYIREPGRTIVEDGDRSYIVHDENDRFRELGYDVHRTRHGDEFIDTIDRPDGVQILTYTDADGRMLRRVRRDRDGREFVLIDNGVDGRIRPYQDDVVDLPPPPLRIPRDRYVVDYQDADEGLIYDTLVAPPLAPPPHRYTLDQIRYSPDVRRYVRSVDINTISFDTASWTVPGSATGKLEALASAVKRAVSRNPNSVFLVEGFTDATGNPTDNLSLSDRRAQSVAAILTKDFNVPPENLTTQGYGQQNLKVDTQGPSAENRRVVVQNITQLLASGNQAPPQE